MFIRQLYNHHLESYGIRCKFCYHLCKVLKKDMPRKYKVMVREAEKALESNYSLDLQHIMIIVGTELTDVNLDAINSALKILSAEEDRERILYNIVCVIKYVISGSITLTCELSLKDYQNLMVMIDCSIIPELGNLTGFLIGQIITGYSKDYKRDINKIVKSYRNTKFVRRVIKRR